MTVSEMSQAAEGLVTRKALAESLGVNPATITSWDTSELITSYGRGRWKRYRVSEVLRDLRNRPAGGEVC